MQRRLLTSAVRACFSGRVCSAQQQLWQHAQLPLVKAASHTVPVTSHARGFAAGAVGLSCHSALRTSSNWKNISALLSRLAYRAKQRGFLELDLLMGDWAERNLPEMTDAELNGFAVVLDLENPDLFKWLTGQLPPPPEMLENPAFTKLLAHVTVFLDENSQKSTRGKLGKEWVRGWSDTGLPSSGNQQ